jgi:pimeloyl-ACP methyl ester carboxylesterase
MDCLEFKIHTMFQERTFPCGDFNLNGAIGPQSGPPILFLHGVTRCWQDFLTLMPSVTLRWTPYAIDFRGHGRSDRAKNYHVADHLQDALAYLNKHFSEPVVIYGHSLGALVAAGLAAAVPEKVRAVILEDPPAEPLLKNIRKTVFRTLFTLFQRFCGDERSLPEMAKDLEGYLNPLPSNSSAKNAVIRDAVSIRFMAKCMKMCDPAVLTPVIDAVWLDGYDVENIFKNVKCPALLFRADESLGGMLAKDEGTRLTRLLSDCTLIEWPGVGHLIHWFQADATAKLLTGFLEAL